MAADAILHARPTTEGQRAPRSARAKPGAPLTRLLLHQHLFRDRPPRTGAAAREAQAQSAPMDHSVAAASEPGT